MREILFRGKAIDNYEWLEGDLLQDGRSFVMIWPQKPVSMSREVDKDTVCQYIGLKDSKGAKIFEGDIVLSDDLVYGEGGLFLIQWNEEWHGWDANRLGAKDDIYTIGELGDMEIVGNCWDTPELLSSETQAKEGVNGE